MLFDLSGSGALIDIFFEGTADFALVAPFVLYNCLHDF